MKQLSLDVVKPSLPGTAAVVAKRCGERVENVAQMLQRAARKGVVVATRQGNRWIYSLAEEVEAGASLQLCAIGWVNGSTTRRPTNDEEDEHDIRAKVASDAENLERAQELLGHKDARTTQAIYRRGIRRVKPAG